MSALLSKISGLKSRLVLLALACLTSATKAQEIEVTPLNLMSGAQAIYPSVFDSTLIFASNHKWDVMKTYYDQMDRHLFQLFKVPLKNGMPSGKPEPYFGKANRPYNIYSAAFGADGTAYVSQNNMDATVVRGGAPISIYEYASDDTKARGVRMEQMPAKANCAMASISEDGELMVFASDMRGGEGRIDLYYCVKTMSGWSEPCNMGPRVNTPGVETSPYIHPSGKIFFASDGREDSQGLDIYYTFRTKDGFAAPIKFDEGVNSERDDYGIYYSKDEKWGYVTSNRKGKDNIYHFRRTFPTFENCDSLETLELCYTLYEESAESYDTTEFVIKWSFGDGQSAMGTEVEHCYAGPGEYSIELSVLDKTTGEEMFSLAQYELPITRPEQLGIIVPSVIRAGQPATFGINLEGMPFFRPMNFYWDMGNGDKVKGSQATTIFEHPGVYRIECGTIDARNPSDRRCTWTDVTVE